MAKKASTSSKKTQQIKQKKAKVNRHSGSGRDIACWVTIAVCVILMLCELGIGGRLGGRIAGLAFGLGGRFAYAFPVIALIFVILSLLRKDDKIIWWKVLCGIVIIFMCNTLFHLFAWSQVSELDLKECYRFCAHNHKGGGMIGGLFAGAFASCFGIVIAYILTILIILICLVLITGLSFTDMIVERRKKLAKAKHRTKKEQAAYEKRQAERAQARMEANDRRKAAKQQYRDDSRLRQQELKEQKSRTRYEEKMTSMLERESAAVERRKEIRGAHVPDIDLRAGGEKPQPAHTDPSGAAGPVGSIYEETLLDQSTWGNSAELFDPYGEESAPAEELKPTDLFAESESHGDSDSFDVFGQRQTDSYADDSEELEDTVFMPSEEVSARRRRSTAASREEAAQYQAEVEKEIAASEEAVLEPYKFPPIEFLAKPERQAGIPDKQLAQTAQKLQDTLDSFGVYTHITDYCYGPSVTRYELQPEQGVKVSRILNLADDIKLSLATPDIRIEAPIPGKSAIGIEVPNQTKSMVTLRELLESPEFQKAESKISFAVGRDIGGKVVVADIFKMPHLLIGGATGSGKSVCINTLIMSILYKASPDEVKFIMIDPKMIELNLYNGIPHLLIPVVTDPKKAAGALQWAVAEMTRRYQYFSALGVRDLKSYNRRIQTYEKTSEEEPDYQPMPQIVIVVDEFADLMMVASGEVEESVCRLAQLARAAGIHLILATQRPSVDVITGLIKANMPSRIALTVSSGVDSRTIIDMIGAEKLLGHGDMLYYPQGLSKPMRVQGAFVSEKEVEAVVEFIRQRNGDAAYDSEVQTQVDASVTVKGGQTVLINETEPDNDRDLYFEEAGRFIIEKEKASIGSLQRMYKIGFNRAARIMDQLCEAGVVGGEEGTKPRRVLMTMEQFEHYLNGTEETGEE